MFGLGGKDKDGYQVWDLGPMPVETRIFHGTVSKEVLEAVQFSDFFRHAQLTGGSPALERYELGGDPPDLIVTPIGKQPLGVELTTLSITDVSRQRLDDVRKLAREITAEMINNLPAHNWLIGKSVSIAEHASDEKRPHKRTKSQRAALVRRFADTLAADFGVADEWQVPNGELPKHIPAEIAMQGRIAVDEYMITVHRTHDESGRVPAVVADIQMRIHESDVRKRLTELIKTKDRPANDVLLITTGLMDRNGYVRPADNYIFDQVRQIQASGLTIDTKHINQVIVHLWGTSQAMAIYQRPDAALLVE